MSDAVKRQAARILIVEDNEAQRQLLCDILNEEGFEPIGFGSVSAAADMIREGGFAVAIVDQRLPDGDGIEVLKSIRNLHPQVRVIIHTGYGSFPSAKEAVNMGAFAYIEKLGKPETLLRHVHRAVQAHFTVALQVSETRHQQLLESVQAIVWRADPETMTFHYVSQEGAALLGYPLEKWRDPISRSSLIHEDDRNRVLQAYRDLIREGGRCVLEYRFYTTVGEVVWVRDNFSLLVPEDGPSQLVGVMIDLTEYKKAEVAHQQLNDELEQRVRLRTLDLETANKELQAFSYSVSHDLRAPLRAINGFADILVRRYTEQLDDDGRRYLENIVEASSHMDRLIKDLLGYSRLGRNAVEHRMVALNDVLKMVCKTLAPRLEASGAVVSIADDLPIIDSHPTLLEQVFLNLFENAITYIRPGILPRIDVAFVQQNETLILGVSDNGVGIAPEYHDKVFRVFQRLHSQEVYPGTGIGLAVVKKAVDLLQGRVWVESAVGEGSTFLVKLPRTRS